MESDRLVARCPDEFLLHRDDVELRILERKSDIIGYRRSIETANCKFEAITIYPTSQIEGQPGPDWITLSVRKSLRYVGLFNRSAITSASYSASILANDSFIGAMTAGYSLRSISIRREFLEKSPELWVESLRFLQRSVVYAISEALFDKLNTALHEFEYIKLSEAELEQSIVDLFLTLLACIDDAKELGTTNRHRVVLLSMLYMKKNPMQRVSPLDLAEATHCSPRTLQYAFRKTLGISPKNYIDRVRLSQFRKALLEAEVDSEQSLQELANGFGFAHGGNLSRSYKKLFGRLPSQRCLCDAHDVEDFHTEHNVDLTAVLGDNSSDNEKRDELERSANSGFEN